VYNSNNSINNCIFSTHATLNITHANRCLFSLLSLQTEPVAWDNFIIYNSHAGELSNDSILNILSEYLETSQSTIDNILIFPYDECDLKKTLTQDLTVWFKLLVDNKFNVPGKTLFLKSDYMLSKNFNEIFNKTNKTNYIWSLPIYNAKQKVSYADILNKLNQPAFIPIDTDTYYRGGSNYPITPKEEISPNNEMDYHESIKFVSHNIVHDYNLHVFSNDVLELANTVTGVMYKDATWGGCIELFRALNSKGIKYLPEIRAYGVHMYHDIISKNRTQDRTDSRKVVPGERY
jgi:hypothetical protein